MYNKAIIRFGFCDIRSNQGLGKCYQPWPSDLLISLLRPWLFRISQKPHPIIILFIIVHHFYLNFDWLPILPGTTWRVQPVLSGHPQGMAKWPLTGWPPNTDCKKYSSKNLISSVLIWSGVWPQIETFISGILIFIIVIIIRKIYYNPSLNNYYYHAQPPPLTIN